MKMLVVLVKYKVKNSNLPQEDERISCFRTLLPLQDDEEITTFPLPIVEKVDNNAPFDFDAAMLLLLDRLDEKITIEDVKAYRKLIKSIADYCRKKPIYLSSSKEMREKLRKSISDLDAAQTFKLMIVRAFSVFKLSGMCL